MKNKSKVLLVVLTAIFVCSAFSVTFAAAQPVEVWNVTETGLDLGLAIAISGGSVYMAGMTDSIDSNASLNKYNSTDGTLIWNITWGGAGQDMGRATATDDNMVYLAGARQADKIEDFVAAFMNKYDSNGTLIWNITWGGPGVYEGTAIATASDGVYMAGDVEPSSGSANYAFLNKYDKDGNLTWNITWGDATCVNSVFGIVTGDNAVYLAGCTGLDTFLNKYDEDGTLIWNTTLVNTTGLATAACDNAVYLAGERGDNDSYAFLVKYSDPAPTPAVTPVPTSTPTPTPTLATTAPIETPTAPPAATPSASATPPGFEAVSAIAGLLAVAFLVMIKRRN